MHNTRNIPFFNYSDLYKCQEDDLNEVIRDVLSRGAFILQEDLLDFEESLKSFLNVSHAFGVADGTNALMLILRATDIGPGDEVIVPSHTYVASAAAIHYVGATPVLVECGKDHMIDPDSARQAVTAKTKAIMPVQLNGRTCDMAAISEIADLHGLSIIEDSAQALGSKFAGQAAGTFGKGGTFSFYPAKMLGCFGDGGAVVTNDDDVARKIFLLRDHGRNEDGEVVAWGTNSRLDNLQAAVLNYKLKTFDRDIARRRRIATMYDEGLRGIAQLYLPPCPNSEPLHYDVYQNYELEAERRDEYKQYLNAHGIKTIIQFGSKAVHQYSGLGLTHYSLPKTEDVYRKALLLPMNTSLSDDDIEYIVNVTRTFYGIGK